MRMQSKKGLQISCCLVILVSFIFLFFSFFFVDERKTALDGRLIKRAFVGLV